MLMNIVSGLVKPHEAFAQTLAFRNKVTAPPSGYLSFEWPRTCDLTSPSRVYPLCSLGFIHRSARYMQTLGPTALSYSISRVVLLLA